MAKTYRHKDTGAELVVSGAKDDYLTELVTADGSGWEAVTAARGASGGEKPQRQQ